MYVGAFFVSSRRRHTRYIGDWSSDVCSSDLGAKVGAARLVYQLPILHGPVIGEVRVGGLRGIVDGLPAGEVRSEERRVGKERKITAALDRTGRKMNKGSSAPAGNQRCRNDHT